MEDKKKYQLYVDLDGVLTNWEKEVEMLGQGTAEEIIEHSGESGLWTVIQDKGVAFWANMEWLPDGKELWSFCKKNNPIILTAPPTVLPGRQYAEKGKKIWIRRELGPDVAYIIKPSKEKRKFATPNAILIDDRQENIKGWVRDGGIGILHTSAKDSIKKLRKLLK